MHKLLIRTCFLVAMLFMVFSFTSFAAETTQPETNTTDVKVEQPAPTPASDTTTQSTQATPEPVQPSASPEQPAEDVASKTDSNEPAVTTEQAPTDKTTPPATQTQTVEPKTEATVQSNEPAQKTAPSTEATPDTTPAVSEPKAAEPAPTTTQHTKILHTNDMHGRILEEDGRVIGMAKLKTVKQQENPDLMLDSGDAFQGLPISNNTKGADMANAMNEVGYDAMAVGNHEFDFGVEQAQKYKEQLNFPILSANTYKDGKLMFDPYTIMNKNGINYGIIGVTTPETAVKTHPDNIKGVTFTEPIPAVQNIMNQIKAQTDIFVILSHLGIDPSTKAEWRGDTLADTLARDRRFYDKEIIVLDGHSHSVIENGKINRNTLLAQTGTALANIGKVEFDYQNGTISNLNASLINVKDTADVTPDPALQQQLDEAKAKFEAQVSEVIIPNNTIQFQGERDDVRRHETNLGNAIADSMEAYSQNGFSHPADFAVTNGGGIRASIDKNQDVTLGDIITVLPFGNTISQIQVKGTDVAKMFEHSLSAPVENGQLGANGAFLHISKSIRVYYDINKAPGERVLKIEVLNKQTQQFEALDPNRIYYMTTNDFTASGGDGYDMLGGLREEGGSLDKVFSDYLREADLSQYDTDKISRIINGQPPVAQTEEQADTETQPATGDTAQPAPNTTTPAVPTQPALQPVASTQTTQPTASTSNVIPFPAATTTAQAGTSQVNASQNSASMTAHQTTTAQVNSTVTNLETIQSHLTTKSSNVYPLHANHAQQQAKTASTTKNDSNTEQTLPDTGSNDLPVWPIGLVLTGLGVAYISRKRDHAA
ncbi:5'-nucleotidase C-terminal domain-containing protein [Staphylococcus simulans]|uniref:5'-nucleotidase C-terminal domain-containing protein n=1 Tax=Staphylococcus simulans TaxID=1286 RepID=UPI000E67DFEF|nr:5'-nucleotidase C-terminal domain-containing protein [Staphylococcus simulans]RIN53202.1 bifunctional metallophosphatase/5'-nucleotidase [Staphylococcus simulans]